MATSATEFTVRIMAYNRENMDEQINEAVAIILERAMAEQSRGILVTRHGSATVTVGLSDGLPFGLTREHQEW